MGLDYTANMCDNRDTGAPLMMEENNRYELLSFTMSLIALFVHVKFNNFRYIIIGLNVGLCAFGFPDLFTTFFSDSISNWVQTIVESDGETGVVGSGIGRVELSICKETEKPKEENIKGGYQVRLLRARDERIIWMGI